MKFLIPVIAEHSDSLYKLIKDSAITNTIAWDGPASLEEFRQGLQDRELRTRNGESHQFTVMDPATMAPIGSADIRPEQGGSFATVGLWIGEPFQGQGIGTEVVKELVKYGFDTVGVERIDAHIFVGNIASRRAFEKCGFSLAETVPNAAIKKGVSLDQWKLSLKREKYLEKFHAHRLFADLSGSELSRLLIETFAKRASSVSPAVVLAAWERDRFVRPSEVSPKDFVLFDSIAFEAASDFLPIELSPICPFGTNTSVAPMSQKKVLSTIRSSEVVADSTNVMALECAVRRRKLLKENPKDATRVKLCASHRLVRVQKFNFPGAAAHFRIFSMCSAGRDTGSYDFEASSMAEHITVLCRLLDGLRANGFVIRDEKVGLFGNEGVLRDRVSAAIQKMAPAIKLEFVGMRDSSYYPTTSFKMKATNHDGIEFEIADGGLTDWTQKLVGSSKERLMISGFGSERTISNFFPPMKI